MAYNKKFKMHNPDAADGTENTNNTVTFEPAAPRMNPAEPEAPRKPFEPVHVEAKFTPEYIHVEDTKVMNDGMEKLLLYLPDDCRDLIREYCKNLDIPLWQAIGGYVVRAREEGTLFSPIILPDWEEMLPGNALRACKTCGDPLKPTTWGQRYCCEYCYFGKLSVFGHKEDCAIAKEAINAPATATA
jgi:hypothetical protein